MTTNLGTFRGVRNMVSAKGNYVPNQFIIEFSKGAIFQSYDSTIAIKLNNGNVTLGENYRYSRTTMRYLNSFLGVDSITEIDKKLSEGTYKLSEDL